MTSSNNKSLLNCLNEDKMKLIQDKFLQMSEGDLNTRLTQATFEKMLETEMKFFGDRLFEIIKKEGDQVSYMDLLYFIQKYDDGTNASKLDLVFDLYDVNADGVLTHDEIVEMIRLNLLENEIIFDDSEQQYILEELSSVLMKKPGTTDHEGMNRTEFHAIFNAAHEHLLNNLPILGFEWLQQSEISNLGRKTKKATVLKKYSKWLSNNKLFFLWIVLYWVTNGGLLAGCLLYLKYNQDALFWSAVGRATGYCLEFNNWVMLLSMMRQTQAQLKPIKGLAFCIPFDDHRYFHELAGTVMLGLGVGHMMSHLLNLSVQVEAQNDWKFLDFLFEMDASKEYGLLGGFAYLSGFPLLLLFLIIFIFTLKWVKGLHGGYNAFYITHIIGYPLYVIICVMHAKNTWKWILGPATLFSFELIIQLYRSYFLNNTTIGVVEILPCRVVKLVIKKPQGFKFNAGDYIFIKIPHFSKFEWHPFTISSPPEDQDITLHIKTVGSWTRNIYDFYSDDSTKFQFNTSNTKPTLKPVIQELDEGCKNHLSGRNKNFMARVEGSQSILTIDAAITLNLPCDASLQVQMDGPYRSPAGTVTQAEHAVLIAAGIGVTPFASILQSIMLSNRGTCLRKLDFIWLNRDHNCFQWFPDLLDKLHSQNQTEPRFFDIQIYNTKALRQIDMTSIMLQHSFDLYYAKTKRDFLSKSRSRMNRGRPDWEDIFKGLKAMRKEKITVFFCGTPKLGKKLKRICFRYGIHFQNEVF